MKNCRDWQETLWLEVYGELGPEEQLRLEKHLETCKACYQERERLLYMLKNVKEAIPEPSLSNDNARTLYNTIAVKIKEEHDGAWWRIPFFRWNIKPVYAMAACIILIVTFGWFGLKGIKHPTPVKIASDAGVEEKMIIKDIDLLENLDLLEELDTLEKLDQVMGKKQATI